MTPFLDRIAPLLHLGFTALAFVAFQRKSKSLGTLAVFGFASMLSGFFLMGWLAIPMLIWARRLRPDIVGAGVLPAALLAGAIIVALRLPWPGPMPTGATVSAEARVQRVVLVDRIWVGLHGRHGGVYYERLPQPFDEVQLQVPATGSAPTAVAVDSVDHDSVDGLGTRPTVSVVMPAGNPAVARIAGGQRNWARTALVRFVTSMYVWGAIWAALSVFVASRFRRRQPAVA